jgi:hypothetical protein
VIFRDQGTREVGKMSNDEWMRAKGFFAVTGMTARDLVAMSVSGELCAVDDDHLRESRGPDSRIQDRQDVIITRSDVIRVLTQLRGERGAAAR